MSWQARNIISTAILLTAVSSASGNARAIAGGGPANEPLPPFLIAEAGLGAQTAAQSSAASSAGSNAAASTMTPATTPSSSAGMSPSQAAPTGLSNPSLLPNSSTTSVTAPTSPNGPAASTPVSSGNNNSAASQAPNMPPPTLTNLTGGTAGKSPAANSGTNSAQLRGLIGSPADASTDKSDDSVASFFQINAAKTGPAYGLINSNTKSGSAPGASHSAFWHIMDNLGVPLPTGNNTEALDPSLRRNYVNPELPNINNYKTRSGKTQNLSGGYQPTPTSSTQTPAATAINMQKIPASELEGVDYSAKNDDQNKQR